MIEKPPISKRRRSKLSTLRGKGSKLLLDNKRIQGFRIKRKRCYRCQCHGVHSYKCLFMICNELVHNS
jgi:hypothetical protein